MKIHEFYRKFEDTPKEQRFEMIQPSAEPTSLFVIFKQLTEVRAQKKFFEDREAYLLSIAEKEFQKLDGKSL